MTNHRRRNGLLAATACVAVVVVALAVILIVSTGPQDSQNNTVNHGYSQSVDWQEATDLISQVNAIEYQLADDPSMPQSQVSQLMSQEAEIVTQTCGVVSKISSPTGDVARFASTNC